MKDGTYTVLIVEDDHNLRMSLGDLLRYEGFEVLSAEDGLEGYQKALVGEPDIIISDIRMPQMDGFELLKKLQENQTTSFTPFIFISAKVEAEDVRAGMALGADDYIIKPFRINDVINTIKTQLRKKEKQVNIFEDFKNSIVKNVAHQLRTPLVSILGLSEILSTNNDDIDLNDIKGIAKNINIAGQKLNKNLEKFMLYTELISQDKVSMEHGGVYKTSTDEISSVVLRKALEYHRENDIELNIESGTTEINTKLINLILTELVDNSLKNSIERSHIKISVECKGSYYILKVTDYGTGINHSKFENIDAFTLLNSGENNQGNLGLGLTIIKKITNIYKGYLNIVSEVNKYTIVEVGLPLIDEINIKAI